VTTIGSERDGIELRLDTSALSAAFTLGPSSCYFWLRTFLFGSLLKHRTYWLRTKSTRFGRSKDKSRAIKVWRINEAPLTGIRPNWVTYHVTPKEQREKNAGRAAALLPTLAGVAGAGSIVLDVHQTGRDIRTPTWMAIPLRTRERSPRAWRQRNPAKVLVVVPDRRNSGRLFLAERIRYMGRRANGVLPSDPKKTKVVRDKLRRRFLLLKSVDMKPTLNFYESWDALGPERAQEFSRISDRILKDIARGKLA
jgi:hypothetical protein